MRHTKTMREFKQAKTIFPRVAAAIFIAAFVSMMMLGLTSFSTAHYEAATTPETEVVPKTDEQETVVSAQPVAIKAPPEVDKHYYDVPLSDELQDYIFEITAEANVPPELIIAVIQNESNFDSEATGAAGEQGYMQIHPINFESLSDKLGVTDFYNPKQNILCGVYLLSQLYNKYDTRNEVLMCYNSGEAGAARLWAEGITETEYCKRIGGIIESLEKRG